MGPTAKRHIALTNTAMAARLDRGKLKREQREQAKGPATCVKYVDKAGRTRFKGTSWLKSSQYRAQFM